MNHRESDMCFVRMHPATHSEANWLSSGNSRPGRTRKHEAQWIARVSHLTRVVPRHYDSRGDPRRIRELAPLPRAVLGFPKGGMCSVKLAMGSTPDTLPENETSPHAEYSLPTAPSPSDVLCAGRAVGRSAGLPSIGRISRSPDCHRTDMMTSASPHGRCLLFGPPGRFPNSSAWPAPQAECRKTGVSTVVGEGRFTDLQRSDLCGHGSLASPGSVSRWPAARLRLIPPDPQRRCPKDSFVTEVARLVFPLLLLGPGGDNAFPPIGHSPSRTADPGPFAPACSLVAVQGSCPVLPRAGGQPRASSSSRNHQQGITMLINPRTARAGGTYNHEQATKLMLDPFVHPVDLSASRPHRLMRELRYRSDVPSDNSGH